MFPVRTPSRPAAGTQQPKIVEVDGDSHRDRPRADARRDRVLTRLGYRVLRMEAGLVLHQPQVVVARIQAVLAGD